MGLLFAAEQEKGEKKNITNEFADCLQVPIATNKEHLTQSH